MAFVSDASHSAQLFRRPPPAFHTHPARPRPAPPARAGRPHPAEFQRLPPPRMPSAAPLTGARTRHGDGAWEERLRPLRRTTAATRLPSGSSRSLYGGLFPIIQPVVTPWLVLLTGWTVWGERFKYRNRVKIRCVSVYLVFTEIQQVL